MRLMMMMMGLKHDVDSEDAEMDYEDVEGSDEGSEDDEDDDSAGDSGSFSSSA